MGKAARTSLRALPAPGPRARLRDRLRWSAQLAMRTPMQSRIPFWSPAALEAKQARLVGAAVAYAYEHVPYYRETLQRLGLRPGDFTCFADLSRLPILEREQLQRDPEYFVSRAQRLELCAKLQSGGSTGEPVTVLRDPLSVFQTNLHAQRRRLLISRIVGRFRFSEVVVSPPSSSGGTLAGTIRRQSLIPPAVRSRRRWLSLFAPASEHVAALNELKPDVVGSYGSFIEALFVYLEASGQPCHLPKVVTYSADELSESARRLITEQFGVTVLSAYQSIESGQLGFECERRLGYHLNMDFCPVRLVDSEGHEVPAGASGDVIVSDLTNRASVLLNYRQGDVARGLPEPCPCGRSLPMISLLEGRAVEWIESADGTLVHPQSVRMLLRKEHEIRRYQVVQRRPDAFGVALVTMPGCDQEQMRQRVADNFRDQFGASTEVAISFVDDLPRTANGKVRPVLSLLGRSPTEAARQLRA